MAEYQLYCFAQSGNAYRCALMLNLIGADWEPIWVDFFAKGEPRTPEYRTTVNEMGEVPVLVHESRTLSQSGVILTSSPSARASSSLRAKTSGSRRCAGSSSTTRRSTAFSAPIASCAISPSRQATRRS
jgi:hypothetical protein